MTELDYSAWEALTSQDRQQIEADIKAGVYKGWPIRSTTQVESITKIIGVGKRLNEDEDKKC